MRQQPDYIVLINGLWMTALRWDTGSSVIHTKDFGSSPRVGPGMDAVIDTVGSEMRDHSPAYLKAEGILVSVVSAGSPSPRPETFERSSSTLK
jgi:hypothetical protein